MTDFIDISLCTHPFLYKNKCVTCGQVLTKPFKGYKRLSDEVMKK